jgi:dolichyl-phosphate beta-glucosyltransferase
MLYGNQRLQRWCFDVELILLADTLGIPLTEVRAWLA